MDIRFTATVPDDSDFHLFRTEDDFIRYLDTLFQPHGGYHSQARNVPMIQARTLRTSEPARYPCIMITAGEHELRSGRDEIHNIFLYDVELVDPVEEDETA